VQPLHLNSWLPLFGFGASAGAAAAGAAATSWRMVAGLSSASLAAARQQTWPPASRLSTLRYRLPTELTMAPVAVGRLAAVMSC
jgi:hypothetical protein